MYTMSANSDVNQSINRLTDKLNCTKSQKSMKHMLVNKAWLISSMQIVKYIINNNLSFLGPVVLLLPKLYIIWLSNRLILNVPHEVVLETCRAH
jgi:hypothetical protein